MNFGAQFFAEQLSDFSLDYFAFAYASKGIPCIQRNPLRSAAWNLRSGCAANQHPSGA